MHMLHGHDASYPAAAYGLAHGAPVLSSCRVGMRPACTEAPHVVHCHRCGKPDTCMGQQVAAGDDGLWWC